MLMRRAGIIGAVAAVVCALLLAAGRAAGAAWPGEELAYVAYNRAVARGQPDIWRLDTTRGIAYNFTRDEAYDDSPAWSPDGAWLAFLSDRDGGTRVYAVRADGSDLHTVTPDPAYYGGVRWSADGERLAFFTSVGTSETLYSAARSGGDLQQMTSEAREVGGMLMEMGIEDVGGGANLSPDQTHVLEMRYSGGVWAVYIGLTERNDGTSPSAHLIRFQADRNSLHRLAGVGRVYNELPRWSPDGEQVAYISDAEGQTDIYLVGVAGGQATHAPARLTHTPAHDSALAWRP